MRLQAGSCTDIGRVREANEDNLLVADGLFAVADGVGGHSAGEVASQTAVETLADAFAAPTLDALVEAVHQANRAVWDQARRRPELRGMGTTLTVLAVVEEGTERQLAVAHVGDSRAYLLRQGELSQLTDDHSLVGEMVREGRLTRKEADVHPQRSIITRALGLDAEVEVDAMPLTPARGDRFLLCSDGLTNEVPEERIASTLRRLADPGEAARDLVQQARASGGSDNITVVIVDVVDDDDRAARASAALASDPTSTGARRRYDPDVAERDALRGAPAPAAPAAPSSRSSRHPGARSFTWRAGIFSIVILAVVGGAAAATAWYARRAYFVGEDGGRVAIYRGRPGGLLWFDPTLVQTTSLCSCSPDIPPAREDDVRAGKEFASLAGARRYIDNLREEAEAIAPTTTTTSLTSTTTTTFVGATPP